MSQGMHTVIYPVSDLDRAKTLYSNLLGVAPYKDEEYFVGFKSGAHDVGLDPYGHKAGMTGPVIYWNVDNITRSLQILLDGGSEIHQELRDVGKGKLIASVKDADGNIIGLAQSA